MDFPGDLLNLRAPQSDINFIQKLSQPPVSLAPQEKIDEAVELLKNAKNPLVIVGKGAAYARAENNTNAFISQTNLPFLPVCETFC